MNKNIPDLTNFKLYKQSKTAEIDGVLYPEFNAKFYRSKGQDGRIKSIGLYFHKNNPVFSAWGYLDDQHCSFHSKYDSLKRAWRTGNTGCPILERDLSTNLIKLDGESLDY